MLETTYKEFIQNILDTRGRFECGDEYHERHHIVPKCLDGGNEEENLIDLFAREHFIAHKLLAKENPNESKLIHAWFAMAYLANKYEYRYELTPEEYENIKIANNSALSTERQGCGNPFFNKYHSSETKKLIGDVSRKAWENDEYRNMQSRISKERWNNEEYRLTQHNSRLKMWENEEYRLRFTESHQGGKHHKAKKVIRLCDEIIYDYLNGAAKENGVSKPTMRKKCKRHDGFMYYDEYLELQKQNELKGE